MAGAKKRKSKELSEAELVAWAKQPHPYGPPCGECGGRLMERYTGEEDARGIPVMVYECPKCGPMTVAATERGFRYVSVH